MKSKHRFSVWTFLFLIATVVCGIGWYATYNNLQDNPLGVPSDTSSTNGESGSLLTALDRITQLEEEISGLNEKLDVYVESRDIYYTLSDAKYENTKLGLQQAISESDLFLLPEYQFQKFDCSEMSAYVE